MPPSIPDPRMLALLGDILGPRPDPADNPLRLRLMEPSFFWQALIDLAAGQDVLVPLIRALRERGLLLPVPRSAVHRHSHPTPQLADIYLAHMARRELQHRQLLRILATLERQRIVALILKGARYLVAPTAPWCEARSMRDIDLLVTAKDGVPAVAALEAEGYASEADSLPGHHHLPPMKHPEEPATLEIHTAAHPLAGLQIMSTQHVWTHAERRSGGGPFALMPLRWHALYLLLHHQISERGHVRQMLAVKGLWEWTMLAAAFSPDDWDAITAHMDATGATDVLGSWLVQSQRLFGADIPRSATVRRQARAHAEITFRRSSAPYWRRRAVFVTDQFRFAFSPETLARRYAMDGAQASMSDGARHLAYLLRHYRGRIWRRIAGRRDRSS